MNTNREMKVKQAVRARDGFRCIRCGMTNEEYLAVHGRQLDVHRVVRGSVYTVEGCVTACQKCHCALHMEQGTTFALSVRPRPKNAVVSLVHFSPEERSRVRRAAGRQGLSTSAFCREVILRVLAEAEAEIENKADIPTVTIDVHRED